MDFNSLNACLLFAEIDGINLFQVHELWLNVKMNFEGVNTSILAGLKRKNRGVAESVLVLLTLDVHVDPATWSLSGAEMLLPLIILRLKTKWRIENSFRNSQVGQGERSQGWLQKVNQSLLWCKWSTSQIYLREWEICLNDLDLFALVSRRQGTSSRTCKDTSGWSER